MKIRAKERDGWIDLKAEGIMKSYIKSTNSDTYEITIWPDTDYISNRLRRYLMGIIRLIYEYRRDELGEEDVTIRKVLHEIERELHPEFDLDVRIYGQPLSKWKSKPSLLIKERLQTLYAPRGLYLPDPNENQKHTDQ